MIERARNLLGLAWKEIASWGSGMDFSIPDYFQDRIDQLENCGARADKPQIDSAARSFGAQSIEPCY
jgi:hypothetical protein